MLTSLLVQSSNVEMPETIREGGEVALSKNFRIIVLTKTWNSKIEEILKLIKDEPGKYS